MHFAIDRQQPFENLVEARDRKHPAKHRNRRAAGNHPAPAPRDLGDRHDRQCAECEMDEPVIMVARPAEQFGQCRPRQHLHPIVIRDIAIGIAPAERVEREEGDNAGERCGR